MGQVADQLARIAEAIDANTAEQRRLNNAVMDGNILINDRMQTETVKLRVDLLKAKRLLDTANQAIRDHNVAENARQVLAGKLAEALDILESS